MAGTAIGPAMVPAVLVLEEPEAAPPRVSPMVPTVGEGPGQLIVAAFLPRNASPLHSIHIGSSCAWNERSSFKSIDWSEDLGSTEPSSHPRSSQNQDLENSEALPKSK